MASTAPRIEGEVLVPEAPSPLRPRDGQVSGKAEGLASRPNIVFFVSTLVAGGAERHTVELAEGLRRRGFAARILVHKADFSPVLTALPGAADAIFFGLKGMSDASGWISVWRTLRRLKPDLIVAVNQTPLIVAAIERFCAATAAKLACIFHTTELQPHERYQGRLFRALAPFCDLMVYVGENQRRVWEARGVRPRRTILVPNGVDSARFARARDAGPAIRQRYGIAATDYLLGILASFRPEKNHSELIRALARARESDIEAKVLCIGDGATRPTVADLANGLGLTAHVIYAGEQSDVAPLLAACDAGVLCSTAETFPLAAIEFLATGVPMIGADVGGVAEIVRDGINGRLYRSGDVLHFAEAIAALSRPEARSPLAAQAAASVAALSFEHMADRYAEAFEALVRS